MKEKGMTTINLKKFNRNKVYQYIYQQKETSKLQIVRDLQMGLSTVSQNLNELEQVLSVFSQTLPGSESSVISCPPTVYTTRITPRGPPERTYPDSVYDLPGVSVTA